MFKTIAIAMLSISPMMLGGCGTMQSQSVAPLGAPAVEAPLHYMPDDDCVWTDTPEDVLADYEWVGEVLDEEADPEVTLYLHCWTGNHR